MQIFNTVNDMRKARLAKGLVLRTLGRDTPNDGQGADYLIVQEGTGTDDGLEFVDLAINQAQRMRQGTVSLPNGALILSGEGEPSQDLIAPQGSLYLRTDGDILTSLYIKVPVLNVLEWVAK